VHDGQSQFVDRGRGAAGSPAEIVTAKFKAPSSETFARSLTGETPWFLVRSLSRGLAAKAPPERSRAVAVQPGSADAGNGRGRSRSPGSARSDFQQGLVLEDDIGLDVLFGRARSRAPGAQGLERARRRRPSTQRGVSSGAGAVTQGRGGGARRGGATSG
jgi:hypothetical protein